MPTPGTRSRRKRAETHGFDSQLLQELAAETRTRATFDIEPTDGLVKLTVTHDDFDADSTLRTMLSEGWPRLLAGLKTLLETGSELEPQSAPAEPAPVA